MQIHNVKKNVCSFPILHYRHLEECLQCNPNFYVDILLEWQFCICLVHTLLPGRSVQSAQNSNPGSHSWESEALPVSHCTLQIQERGLLPQRWSSVIPYPVIHCLSSHFPAPLSVQRRQLEAHTGSRRKLSIMMTLKSNWLLQTLQPKVILPTRRVYTYACSYVQLILLANNVCLVGHWQYLTHFISCALSDTKPPMRDYLRKQENSRTRLCLQYDSNTYNNNVYSCIASYPITFIVLYTQDWYMKGKNQI